MFSKPLTYYLGNGLIAVSLLILAVIYLPILRAYLPPDKSALANSSFIISIPKINAYAPVVENVDPWNESDYKEALKHGVAQAKGFALPGAHGPIYLFAHSSDYPWNITRYNTVFLRLGELKNGDQISILKDGKTYDYQVTDKKEVWPDQVEFLKSTQDQLILQTCTPIGTAFKRLLIFAKPLQ